MWKQNEALKICSDFESFASKFGCHVGLAGSVLYRGDSIKDLDIILYPHDKKNNPLWRKDSMDSIKKFFGVEVVKECKSSASQIRDGKSVVWIKTNDGKRIDFFLLD